MTLDELINLILDNLKKAREGTLPENKYAPMAAACLEAQLELAQVIANDEFEARSAKTEMESSQGERSIELREKSESKITDAAMVSLLAKDSVVKESKKIYAEKERESKKYNLINATLSNAHVFFRGLDKSNKGF